MEINTLKWLQLCRIQQRRCFTKWRREVSHSHWHVPPTPELLDLLEAIVKEKWAERVSELQHKHSQHKSDLEERKDYINKLTEKLVKGIIPDDIYKQQVAEVQGRINVLELEIENFNIKHSDIFMILLRARRVLENPSKSWQEANGQQRRNIQKALFPLGVLYSKERGLETPLSTSVYNLLQLYKDLQNDMATPTGIEPVLPAWKASVLTARRWGRRKLPTMATELYFVNTLQWALVSRGGIEPPTLWLKVRCSTYWASGSP